MAKPDLSATKERLRAMASYLMETVLRAKVNGITTPAFSLDGLINMAADLTKAVVDLEGHLSDTPGTAASPAAPAANGAAGRNLNELSQKLSQDIRAQAEEIQRSALNNLREQFAAMQRDLFEKTKTAQPAPTPGPPPAPTAFVGT